MMQQFGGGQQFDASMLPEELFREQAQRSARLGLVVRAILEKHDGPLCTACEDGYSLNRLDGTCMKCDEDAMRQSKWELGLACAGVTMVGTATFFFYR